MRAAFCVLVRLGRILGRIPLFNSTVLIAGLLLFWQFGAGSGLVPIIPAKYLGSPLAVWQAFINLAEHGYTGTPLWLEIGVSLVRALVGFTVAAALAIPLGLIIGFNKTLDRTFVPIISFLRPIPALAFIPIVVIWFGLGEFSIVLVIFISSFFFTITGAYLGARSVPREYLMVAANCHLSYLSTLWRVVLPPALPQILSGARTGLMVAWAVLVAAELIGATEGLGYLVQSAAQYFLISDVYVGIFFIGLIGIAFELSIQVLERRLLHWTTEG